MRETNMKTSNYDLGYRILHWLMAVLILLMLVAVVGFASVTNNQEHMEMLMGHSSLGILVSIFLLIRLFKRFVKKSPMPEHDLPELQKRLSKLVQYGLYALMIWIPVTGYLTARFHELPVMAYGSFNLSSISNGAGVYSAELFDALRLGHEIGTKLIMLLLVMHIGAAFYHKLVKKDQVMKSMTGSK